MPIDPRLYGGAAQEPFVPVGVDPTKPAGPDLTKLHGVPDIRAAVPLEGAFDASVPAGVGRAAEASGDRERASVLAAAGAGFVQTDFAAILRSVTDEHYEPDPAYSAWDHLQRIPLKLTQDEKDYFSKAKSVPDGQARLERIQYLRTAQEALGDHPVIGATAMIAGDATSWAAGAGTTAVAAKLGRVAGVATGVAQGTVIQGLAAQSQPTSLETAVLGVLAEGAVGLFVPNKTTGKLVPHDPDFPAEELHTLSTEKPKVRQVSPAEYVDEVVQTPAGEQVVRRKVKDAVFEELPKELQSTARVREPDAVAKAVETVAEDQAKSWAQRVGEGLQWNIRKTMASYSEVGKRIADTLFDNNSDLSKTSVESHHRSVKADLSNLQWKFEGEMRAALAEQGFGTFGMIFKKGGAAAQAALGEQVSLEMLRRQQLGRLGRPIDFGGVPPRVKAMADHMDALYKRASQELKAAGVVGAEELQHSAGFFNRRWDSAKIEAITQKFMNTGLDAKAAHQKTVRIVAAAMRRANGWDDVLAYNVAASTINRALRKGAFEDAAFSPSFGKDAAARVRDMLTEEGLHGHELQRVMDVLVGKQDETAKAGFLKHRVDMDYSSATMIDGELVRVTDMLDTNIAHIVDRYIDGVSTQVAFARSGLKSESDILTLRRELEASTKGTAKHEESIRLFDQTVAHLRGEPTGADIGNFLRNTSAVGRMISLANSALWQMTEYSTAMAKYGALKTINYAIKELPGFKGLLDSAAKDAKVGQNLKDILVQNSGQNLRLRPFLSRFEDGFEIDPSHTVSMRLQQAQQLVPYFNGMKWMHGHQARITANLVLDSITRAVRGEAGYAEKLAKYGVDTKSMASLSEQVQKHAFDVDKWDDATWAAVRPAFTKMMDESVLHQRVGDMPAFALLNPVGKFIFTYRSFVLTAHNKILAGTLARDGLAGASLMLAYQFPLAALAVQAQATLQHKKEMSASELAVRAVGQMGGVGLGSEIWGVLTGSKKQWGAPGLIPIDRGIGLVGDTASAAFGNGTWGRVGADLTGVVPLLSLLQPMKALGNLAKEQ